MIDSTENRAARRAKARTARTTAVSGIAAAAMAVGLAGAPQAGAATTINITWNPAYTAGGLAGLLNFVGNAVPGLSVGGGLYNSGPPQNIFASVDAGSLPLLGPTTLNLTLLLKYLNDSSRKGLYNTLGSTPQLSSCTGNYATRCRYALELATSEATGNLVEAYRTQIQSVTTGQTPPGYIPFEAAPGSTAARPTQTNQALVFVQNPLRPNGGFYTRFPEVAKLFGVEPEMPAAGIYRSPDQLIALNTSTLDVTWAYDPNADLPAVFSLAAFANSLAAALPLNLVTGTQTDLVLTDANGATVTTTDLGLNLAAVLQMGPLPIIGTLPMTTGQAYYGTLVSNTLPLVVPLQLPGLGINAVLSALNSPYLLGNPFVDAIEPALKILVNIAYPDVVTPSEGGTYNRTFLTSGTPTPFGSVQPLTPEEKKAVPGDVWNALVEGVKAQFAKPFWGILVPNPDNPPAGSATPAPAAVRAAAATPAPEPVAPVAVSAPVPEPPASVPPAPVEAPAAPVAESAPAVAVSIPAADPAPTADLSAVADDPAPAAPRAGSRRGASAASSDNADGPKAAASTGRHRGAS